MNQFWEFALTLNFGERIITPKVFDAAGSLRKKLDVDYSGMTAEEIYDDLLARMSPLDAIVRAVEKEE